MTLRWTKEPPTVKGWYWCWSHHLRETEMVYLEMNAPAYCNVFVALRDEWLALGADFYDARWAGPIPEPEEP